MADISTECLFALKSLVQPVERLITAAGQNGNIIMLRQGAKPFIVFSLTRLGDLTGKFSHRRHHHLVYQNTPDSTGHRQEQNNQNAQLDRQLFKSLVG